jgi:serine protease Do
MNDEEINKKESSKERNIRAFAILVGVLAIAILGYIAYNANIIKKNSKNNVVTNEKVELQHTTVNTEVKEGVYITDVSEVVENVMPSIVAITSKKLIATTNPFSFWGFQDNTEKYSEGAGSGIIISQTKEDVYILTNNHVVSGATELSVQFIDGKSVDAIVKGTSTAKDIAVLVVKIKDIEESTLESIKIATLGNSNDLKVGNGIIAIGNALGYGQSVTTGVISALNRILASDSYSNKMIQIDAAINGGNSGGALLNSKGEVVGINSAKYSSNALSSSASIEGMGFAIPISDVEEIITALMNGKKPEEGIKLGIEGYMTTDPQIAMYNFPEGFYVANIIKDSNAYNSELEIGNIITEVDGKKVESVETISGVLASKKKGDKVKLKVKYISNREYKEKEISIKLS